MENSIDTIWDRTRDIPACSAVPQPTAPPGAPIKYINIIISYEWICRYLFDIRSDTVARI